MASSSSSKNVTIYAVNDEEPIIIDDSEFVSEPDMTSVEDNIWGEELMIPHKLGGRTLAFAGPLPSSGNFSEDPAGTTIPTAAAASGEGQRDKEKASVETSEAGMPPNPKKKADKEKKKKKKVKANPKPSAETEKDIEIPDSTSPVEDQPTINVEAPSTGGPAPILEKINPSLQDPSDQDGNEGNATILVNDEDSLAQDVGTNNVERSIRQ
ncbi:hypothetical protein P8452_42745 [Trifolium repens]|nr:hypothetical protein P8452_42745 [Trifolium repens]